MLEWLPPTCSMCVLDNAPMNIYSIVLATKLLLRRMTDIDFIQWELGYQSYWFWAFITNRAISFISYHVPRFSQVKNTAHIQFFLLLLLWPHPGVGKTGRSLISALFDGLSDLLGSGALTQQVLYFHSLHWIVRYFIFPPKKMIFLLNFSSGNVKI